MRYTIQPSGFGYWVIMEDGKVIATEPDGLSAEVTRDELDRAQITQVEE